MKKSIVIGSLILSSTVASLAYCSGGGGENEGSKWFKPQLDVAPITNQLYQNECASCHMGYQPGLLPERSWQKLMSGLEDHFGDNAELTPESYTAILKYLTDNAADKSDYKRSRRIANSLADNETPLRITDTDYFKRKHRELSLRTITSNAEIGSISNCIACHRQADKGSFNENEIRIPGSLRRWD